MFGRKERANQWKREIVTTNFWNDWHCSSAVTVGHAFPSDLDRNPARVRLQKEKGRKIPAPKMKDFRLDVNQTLFYTGSFWSIINLLSCICPSFQYKSAYQFSRKCLPQGGGLSFTEFGLRVRISAGINRLPPSLISGKLANQLMTDIASSSRDADFLEHQYASVSPLEPQEEFIEEFSLSFFPQDFGFSFQLYQQNIYTRFTHLKM